MSTCTKMKRILNCHMLCRIRDLPLQKDGVRHMGFMDKFRSKKEKEDQAAYDAGLRKKKRVPFSKQINEDGTRKIRPTDGYTTSERMDILNLRQGFERTRAYSPPSDVEEVIRKIVQDVCGPSEDWKSITLDNRQIKFKLLTRCLKELDHFMPHMDLNNIKTVEDVVSYFSTTVHGTTVIEELVKHDLPKNLHINTKYIDHKSGSLFEGYKSPFGKKSKELYSIKYWHQNKTPSDT